MNALQSRTGDIVVIGEAMIEAAYLGHALAAEVIGHRGAIAPTVPHGRLGGTLLPTLYT